MYQENRPTMRAPSCMYMVEGDASVCAQSVYAEVTSLCYCGRHKSTTYLTCMYHLESMLYDACGAGDAARWHRVG